MRLFDTRSVFCYLRPVPLLRRADSDMQHPVAQKFLPLAAALFAVALVAKGAPFFAAVIGAAFFVLTVHFAAGFIGAISRRSSAPENVD